MTGMTMRVDKPGKQQFAAAVYHPIAGGGLQGAGGVNGGDPVGLDTQGRVFKYAAGCVHRDDGGMSEKRSHDRAFRRPEVPDEIGRTHWKIGGQLEVSRPRPGVDGGQNARCADASRMSRTKLDRGDFFSIRL
ncbi:hypothetical protein [Paracoccus xiamenensis]|uniref:hypothetical protein n=1 Tax=Paracoccus xiamenensis TaxID=2714901 RepID=UPI001F25F3DA|nr:hypothetical protein [Paracoccus xiamenensis]